MESERITSFERGVPVVSKSGWILLGSIALLLACSVAWSFLGKISTVVTGNCIFMKSTGIVEVSAPAGGRLVDVNVRAGNAVRVGQTIGQIAQPDLEERIRRAQARLRELESRAGELASLSKRGLELSEEVLAQRAQFLREQIALAESQVQIAVEHEATVQQLLRDGLVTRRAVEDAAQNLRAAEISVRDFNRQLAELERVRTDTLKRETDERATANLELSDARRELAALEGERGRTTAIVSPFAGRVIEVKASRGSLIGKDVSVISLERTGQGEDSLQVVMYVAASDGKKLQPGGEVHIVPATVRREEYGHVLGSVSYVSDYPATPRTLLASLGSEELVRDLASVPAPYEIRILPSMEQGAVQWSRSAAVRPPLLPGTLCRGEVVVRRERPVGFVIPALRHETS